MIAFHFTKVLFIVQTRKLKGGGVAGGGNKITRLSLEEQVLKLLEPV